MANKSRSAGAAGAKWWKLAQAWHVCEKRVATFTCSPLLKANGHPIAERRKLKPRPRWGSGEDPASRAG